MTTTHNSKPIADTYDVYYPGQHVVLTIGGPPLLVVETCDDCGEVEVVYVDSAGDLVFNTLPSELLVALP